MSVIYRHALETDTQMVVDYCAKEKLEVPRTGFILLAVHTVDLGKGKEERLMGICALRQIHQVEPLIADTPHIAQHLACMVEGAAMLNNAKELWCWTSPARAGLVELFDKWGFETSDVQMTIMRKKLE